MRYTHFFTALGAARTAALAAIALALAGCESIDGLINPPPPPHGTVVRIEVVPGDVTMRRGETLQLRANAEFEDGAVIEVRPRWWVKPGGVTVDDDGLLTAVSTGEEAVFAIYGAHSAYSQVAVIPGCLEPDPGDVIDVGITGLQLIQVVDLGPGELPARAGKDVLVRAFVERSDVLDEMGLPLALTVTASRNGDEIGAVSSQVGCGEIVNDPDDLLTTMNVAVPSDWLGDGLELVATLELPPGVEASPTSDLRYPTFGSLAPGYEEPPPFDITFVPIIVDGVGAVYDSAAAAVSMYWTREVFPLDDVRIDVREPYVFTGSSSGDNADSEFLAELMQLRLLDGASSYYHGVVPPEAPDTWAVGRGFLTHPVAYTKQYMANHASGYTVAHELGHNFGREHAPCGDAPTPDEEFPYPDGRMGVYGYGPTDEYLSAWALYGPGTGDVMGYCVPRWISDYTYVHVAEFRSEEAHTAAARRSGPTLALLVSGTIDRFGRASLQPLFTLETVPAPPARGEWRFELLSGRGAVLSSVSFDAYEIADDAVHADRHFAFTLPVSAQALAAATSVRVVGSAGEEVGRLTDTLRSRASGPLAPPSAKWQGDGTAVVEWDAVAYPAVIFFDPDTGLAIGRGEGGRAVLPLRGATLDVLFSSGLHSFRLNLSVR